MSFISNFMQSNAGNECPKPYVLWTAYGLLSATIGYRVYLDLEHFKVRPNIYILLVGPSGGRKTVARDKGVELLLSAVPDIVLAGDNETYQGVISYMHSENSARRFIGLDGKEITYRPYCVFAPELMDYLQLNPIGMVAFLTNLYDRSFYTYRLKNEEHVLENPYIMMCACSTPEWLTDQLKAKQFSEGYGRRTIIVCHEGIVKKKPTFSDAERQAVVRCKIRLHEIQNIIGPMVLEPSADKWFWDWYLSSKEPDDKFLRNWNSTKHVNLLKIAMLTSLSERDDRIITIPYLQMSLEMLNEVERGLPMITNLMGRSELTIPCANILNILRLHGGVMSCKEVKLKTYKDFKSSMEQWQVIEHLKNTEQIVEGQTANGIKVYALPSYAQTPNSTNETKQ